MTHLSEADIIILVRRTINEAKINESEYYSGEDETEMDNIIKSRILEALRFVNEKADVELLEPDKVVTTIDTTKKVGDYVCGIVRVPGFHRIVRIRVDGWKKTLTDIVYDDDQTYLMQSDCYTCGTPDKPVAYICNDIDGNRTIELYSLPPVAESTTPESEAGATVSPYRIRLEYMSLQTELNENDRGIDISDRVKEAYVCYLSFLVLAILNDQHADDFLNMALQLLGVSQNNTQQ